jgi:predicted dehydrogenase
MKDRVKMVFVGLRFGLEVIRRDYLNPTVAEPGLEVTGVCDLDTEKAQAAGEELNLKVYTSLDDVLKDPNVDAIGLFTGPAGRAGLIKKIIRAGKHVMTTKPFELDAEAALDVLQEARELKKVVHLNSPGPLPAAETEQVLQWAHEYDLGRPISIQWETYADYTESADGNWYDDPEKCPVAPIFRLGIYGINQIIRLCGAVDEVGVVHSRIRTGRPTPDNGLMSLKFKSSAIGSVHVSFCVNNGILYPDELTLHYERGTIRTTAVEADEYGEMSLKQVSLQTVDSTGNIVKQKVSFEQKLLTGKYQWSNFYKAVKSGSPLHGETMPEQIVAGIQVVNAMAEAEKTGSNVKIKELKASKELVS